MYSYGIIILAAGDSDRLGFPKQLLEYNGETFIRRAITVASELEVPIVTVLGHESTRIEKGIKDLKTDCTFNLDWKKGVGTSIREGFTYLHKNYPRVNAILILTCDQPYVDQELLLEMIRLHQEDNPIVAASFDGQLGMPVLIDSCHFKELLKLNGHTGLELLLMAFYVKEVPFPLGSVDINTEEDWKLFFSQAKNNKAS